MKFFTAVLFGFCFLALEGVQGLPLEERGISNCDKLHDYVKKYLEEAKKNFPSKYNLMKMGMKTFNFDVENDASLRPFMCKLADAKTLKDIHNMMPVLPYDQLVNAYRMAQKLEANLGGYSNTRRFLEAGFDFMDWLKSLNVRNPVDIKNSYKLEDVERFFEVMQIKFGSRWISWIVMAENQNMLIEDPKVLAKNLFECQGEKDFQQKTGFTEHEVSALWRTFQTNKVFMIEQSMVTRDNIDFIAEGENLVGELGLYNLEY